MTWKVVENDFGPGKSWKFKFREGPVKSWNMLGHGRNDADMMQKYSRLHTSSFHDSFLQ